MRYKIFALLFLFITGGLVVFSQTASSTEETDFMNGEGKIYVVMVVCIVIIAGLIIYLINLDRKISRLERMKKE
jgi:TRAP-type C4-dicarboxylate transport system permease small subunit